MTEEKLEKRIRDWAISLGFKMPDGSLPPPGFFALLTATPNRNELWKTLLEKIQPKEKIKLKRSQILALELKQSKRNSVSKLELLKKQKSVETQIKERKEQNISIEKNIMAKASDLLFEISKMIELEKMSDEFKEKSLVLKLLMHREKKLMERLENLLLRIPGSFRKKSFLTKDFDLQVNFMNTEDFSMECSTAGQCQSSNKCNLLKKINEICESQTSEQKLWEEIIKSKKLFLKNFFQFLEGLEEIGKKKIEEKVKYEEEFKLLIQKLKQEMTETSLQALINEVDSQLLLQEINNILEKIEEGGLPRRQSLSFVVSKTNSNLRGDVEEVLFKIRGQINNAGLNRYHEFLKEELMNLEEECKKAEEEVRDFNDVKEEYHKTLELCTSVRNEIHNEISKEEDQTREIMQKKEEILTFMKVVINKTKDPNFINEIEETFRKMKNSAKQQVELYVDTPLNAPGITNSAAGEPQFVSESLQRSLSNHGELKQIFRSMLISPCQDFNSIVEEVKKRKKLMEETTKFVLERDKLSVNQKEFSSRLASLNHASTNWDTQYYESVKILSRAQLRSNDVDRKMKFVGKILKNWLDQPYRLMVNNLETYKKPKIKEIIKEEPEENTE